MAAIAKYRLHFNSVIFWVGLNPENIPSHPIHSERLRFASGLDYSCVAFRVSSLTINFALKKEHYIYSGKITKKNWNYSNIRIRNPVSSIKSLVASQFFSQSVLLMVSEHLGQI